MARFSRTKTVYVDIASGRLIPKKLAERRPPDTWRAEEVAIDIEVADSGLFGDQSSASAQPTGASASASSPSSTIQSASNEEPEQ